MRPLGETIARRRVFWPLVALVVVPTVLLAFYGLAGLKNQSDAEEARLRERFLLQSRVIEAGIVARLAEEDTRVRAALAGLPDEQVADALPSLLGGVFDAAWSADDPGAPPAVLDAFARARDDEDLTFVGLEREAGRELLVLSRVRPGVEVALRVDVAAVDALVLPGIVGREFPSEQASYHLVPAIPDPGDDPVSPESFRRALAGALGPEPDVDRALSPPFQHWRVRVTSTGPVATGSGTRRVTIVLLLAATVVTGVTLMGRAVVQQVRLSRLQTDFVSNVSHELRTPLTSIRLFIETLQSGRVTDPEKVRECLEVIATESERLSHKVERVLAWARLESGRWLWHMEPIAPRELVDAALVAFRAQNLDGDVTVEVDLPADLPLVRADRDGMVEALLNLLSNALKYGGPGVRVRIDGAADRRGVSLAVQDTGPGIPANERARIFEKFYRPELLQSRRAQGSGLGLAIVKAIVQAHKGQVDVDSEEGRGARFTVWVPRA